MKTLPYWDSTNVIFSVGARGIGKTLMLEHAGCLLWECFKLPTMWARTRKVEVEEPGFYNGFLNGMKKRGWCPSSWVAGPQGVWDSDDENNKGKDKKLIFEFQGLSTYSNRRGNESDIRMIVLDEFCPENRRWMKNSGTALMSLCRTILRGKPHTKCFCLSNYISAGNPFWMKYKIYPKKDKDVTWFPNKMVIEIARGYNKVQDDDDPWADTFKGAGYRDYADEIEDALFGYVQKIPKGCKDTGVVLVNEGNRYGCYTKNGKYYFNEFKGSTNNKILLTPNITEQGNGVRLMTPFTVNQYKVFFEMGLCRFNDPNVLFGVLLCLYTEF